MTEDAFLGSEQLRKKYGSWSSHPQFPVSDWQYEVANNETRTSYWDWVATKLEDNA